MIVKNEEDVLSRVLSQAKKFADEIVIVDTGSTDSTKEIAKKYTALVFDFKWCDNFSAARNYAFSLGKCDYLMWLDADDFVTDENIEKILKLKNQNSDADVFMCKYSMNFDADGFAELSFYRERILKREKNFKWNGFVHEVITPSGKIEYTDIEIQHRKVRPTPKARNLKIYEKALKNGVKFSPRELYYYARELYYNKKYSLAAKTLKKFLKLPAYPPDNFEAHLLLADCQDALSALSTLFDCLKKHSPNGEICCKIANNFEKINEIERAIFWYNCALFCPPQSGGFVREEYNAFVPNVELSRLLYHTNYPLAKQHYEKAKALRPNSEVIHHNEKFFEK